MWTAIWAILSALAKGLGAYFNYKYDPAAISKREEIHKKAAEEVGYEKINLVLATKNILSLGFFVSEFLRGRKGTDSTPGWATDLLNRKLPQQRSAEDREADTQEGFDDE